MLILVVGITIYFVSISDSTTLSDSSLSVPTSSGILLGEYSSIFNEKLRLYLGVPYAEPPIDGKRFQPPIPIKGERIERDATQFGPSCIQPKHLESVISPLLKPNRAAISEDCLYLNIYVPENEAEKKVPVMVWLPGEGFDFADPQQYDGSYLAVEGNVIVVTVNYRLSVFGFLSSLSDDAPGNVGLLDQRMALKWVKENIAHFGGDAENVTLFGRLTGSMSAVIHSFSPLSKQEQLFERVILQSGMPSGDWVFDHNPLNSTKAIAEATNCKSMDMKETIMCLKNVSADDLLRAAMSLPMRFRPIYDFSLISESPIKAAKKSDYNPIDVMIGMNNDEGSLCMIALDAMQSPQHKKILLNNLSSSDFHQLVRHNMIDFFKEEDPLLENLTLFTYSDSNQLRKRFINFCGDLLIISRSQQLADILSNKGENVYIYELEHRPSFSIHPNFIRAAHGDDVLYSFALPYQMTDLPEDEVRLTKAVVKSFTNFARTGNPSTSESQWPRYTSSAHEVMSFSIFPDEKVQSVIRSYHEAAVTFWTEIIPSLQKRSCPGSTPMASKLVHSDTSEVSQHATIFLGKHVPLPVAEYVMMGLLGAAGFLLVVLILTVRQLLRARSPTTFHRLG